MCYIKHSLEKMFDLLNQQQELILSEISKECDAVRKSELNQDLKNVMIILQELNTASAKQR